MTLYNAVFQQPGPLKAGGKVSIVVFWQLCGILIQGNKGEKKTLEDIT